MKLALQKHDFSWVQSGITEEDADLSRLVKGVAITEGEYKSWGAIGPDEISMGAGAMRASALMGKAHLNVDHIASSDKLPPDYIEKYPGIEDPYPVGQIIDAQSVVGPDGKRQAEFIAYITNDVVYSLIRDRKIVGNSVETIIRDMDCSGNAEGPAAGCMETGSAFLRLGLMLEEVPDSDGTWVDVVTADDVEIVGKETEADDGFWFFNLGGKKRHALRSPALIRAIRRAHKTGHPFAAHAMAAHSSPPNNNNNSSKALPLETFLTPEGEWRDGVTSISMFLQSDKGINAELADEIGEWIIENPDALSHYQIAYLSQADLLAWWGVTRSLGGGAVVMPSPSPSHSHATTTPHNNDDDEVIATTTAADMEGEEADDDDGDQEEGGAAADAAAAGCDCDCHHDDNAQSGDTPEEEEEEEPPAADITTTTPAKADHSRATPPPPPQTRRRQTAGPPTLAATAAARTHSAVTATLPDTADHARLTQERRHALEERALDGRIALIKSQMQDYSYSAWATGKSGRDADTIYLELRHELRELEETKKNMTPVPYQA